MRSDNNIPDNASVWWLYLDNLLVSQLVPVMPVGHVQIYWLTRSVHVPPFWHGKLAHSLLSEIQLVKNENYLIQIISNLIHIIL